MKTLFISTLLAFATCAAFAQSPDLTLARDKKQSRAVELPQIPVHFTLDKPGVVTLVVDDADGKRVRNLTSETLFEAGEHVVQWDGRDDHKPERVDAQPVFRFEGDPVPPGRYVVRGIVHDPVQLRYEMPLYTAGNPPWDTPDGRGGWLNDFGPALTVASLPGETPMMLIGSGVGEAFGIVWTDLDGQRLAGLRGVAAGSGWCGGELLAHDGGPQADLAVTAYVGNNWQGGFEIEAMTQKPPVGAYNNAVRTMSMALWGAGRKIYQGVPGQNLSGIAARDMTVVAAIDNQDKLVVIRDASQHNFGLRHGNPTVPDQRSGTLASEVPLTSPRGLAVTADGHHLLAISGQRLLRFPFPPQGEPTVLVAEGLQNPQQLALDQDGNIYVSDPGSHQVKVFTPDGKPLRSIGEPGGPQLGPYNELRMANPQGIAISADGRLWVAEASEFPRRVSVWECDGTFVKALYGNGNYGGGGMLDAGDRNRAYVSQGGGALQLRLDWKKGASAVEKILWLPDERRSLPAVAYHIPFARLMGHAVYHDGRRYLSNAYCTAAGGGNHSDNTITLWRMNDQGLPVLAASLGAAQSWSLLKQPEFADRWPDGLDPKSDFALCAWSDLDGNGKVDPAEVWILAKPEWKRLGNPNTFTLSEDLAIVDCLGNRYRPVRFTEAGAPVYDLDTNDNIFPGARPTGTSGGGQVVDGGDGWAVATWSPETMPPGYVTGAKDGVVRWRYPARAVGNHAGYVVGPPDKPGELIAISGLAGRPFTPRGTKERLWAMVGLKGNLSVLTTDGMFVATLFKDWRQGKPGPANAARGVSLNDMSLGDDAWATTMAQSNDGNVYVVGGHDSTWITRVEGLETIRRLPEREVSIAEETAQWLDQYKDGGRQRLSVKKVAGMTASVTDVPVLVTLTSERFDFAKSTPAGSDIRFTAADGVTLLEFERVRHDAKAGEAIYWLRLPRVWAHGVNFYVYSRPATNTDLSAAARMWPAATCRAVLHMDESSGDRLHDATSNARHVGLGSRTLNATGQIGLGSGGTASAGDLPGTAMLAGSFTYSAWIKPAAYNTQIAYQDTPGTSQTYTLSLDASGKVATWHHTGNEVVTLTGATAVPLNQWTHVAHVLGGGTQTVYLNGVQDASGGAGAGVWYGGGGTRMIPISGFNGTIDEGRLVNGALSGPRIMMEYLSERDNLLRYGEREDFNANPR